MLAVINSNWFDLICKIKSLLYLDENQKSIKHLNPYNILVYQKPIQKIFSFIVSRAKPHLVKNLCILVRGRIKSIWNYFLFIKNMEKSFLESDILLVKKVILQKFVITSTWKLELTCRKNIQYAKCDNIYRNHFQ